MPHACSRLMSLIAMIYLTTPALSAEPAVTAKVTDLGWMTGHWEGAMGDDGSILEENWTQPKAGSIASLVRLANGTATNMIELIVIEQEPNGSLTLRLQQWDPGYKPRTPGPMVMRLIEVGDQRLMFENVGDGFLKKLGYSREGKKFLVSAVTSEDQSVQFTLHAK